MVKQIIGLKGLSFQISLKQICLALTLVMALQVSGCSTSKETLPENLVHCEDPRPEMCTLEYLPVCGFLTDGQSKTYGNGCGACAVKEVVGFLPQACPG